MTLTLADFQPLIDVWADNITVILLFLVSVGVFSYGVRLFRKYARV